MKSDQEEGGGAVVRSENGDQREDAEGQSVAGRFNAFSLSCLLFLLYA